MKRNFGYAIAVGFAALMLVNTAIARSACTIQDAPVYRGLALGMSRKQFLARFPGTRPINMLNREQLSRVQGFSGLEMLAFRMSADKLDQFEIRHAGLSGGMERLTRRISRELGLPHDAWEVSDTKAEMTCLTFRVTADTETNGFTLTDLAADENWKKMREKAERRN